MNVLFPQNPSMRKLSEPLFEPEFDAAEALGFACLLFDEEAFSAGDIDRATIYQVIGINAETSLRSQDGRPQPVLPSGQVIPGVFV
jgi:hypothetical protein